MPRDYGDEEVLVIDEEQVVLISESITPMTPELLEILQRHSYLAPRSSVEGHPGQKQIIPYCTLYCVNEDGEDFLTGKRGVTRLFYAQRRAGADRELADKWTIGLGGHVNQTDFTTPIIPMPNIPKTHTLHRQQLITNLERAIYANMIRELQEELEIDLDDIEEIRYVGIIYSEADAVSMDHIGISVMMKMKTQNTRIKENGELFRGGFFTETEWKLFVDYVDLLNSIHTPSETS